MDFYKSNIPIIDDTPEGRSYAMPGKVDGTTIGFGYVPRDYKVHPKEMFDAPSGLKIYEESEWDALYDQQEAEQSSLEHRYLSGPNGTPVFVNLDQNGDGDCWAYSTGHSLMFNLLKQNQVDQNGKIARLNPHSIAACLRQMNGGWCGLSGKFVREVGCAIEGTGKNEWPLHSHNTKLDTPEMRTAMARFQCVEDWTDLTRDVTSQNLTEKMLATLNFINVACPTDYNWWSHSVCRIRTVRIEKGSWGALILNSWRGWGRHGLGVLRGSQARANGAIGLRQIAA